MTNPKKILVIGGGFSGMSAAISLRKAGCTVDLIEIDPQWRSYGAGISLSSASLRALKQIGVIEAFMKEGSAHDGVTLHLPNGQPIGSIPTPRLAGPDIPGGGAIMRPALAKLMGAATRHAGVNVRLGIGFTHLAQTAEHAQVTFSDGSSATYDLVVGADGLNSSVRRGLFPQAPRPRYTGQAVWRCVLERPAEVTSTMMWIGRVKPGINPVSASHLYMFLTEHQPNNVYVDSASFPEKLRTLLADFSDPLVQKLRAQISDASQIVYRPLEALLLPRPWFNGRVVLIGDAVHATTPHLASGACIGIEDGIVLAESVAANADMQAALLAFQNRRWERCRMVVENSLKLGELEMTNGNKDEHARIMRESVGAMMEGI